VWANEEPHRVRDDLSGRLADAYNRYMVNRDQLLIYRNDILPKQVQAFRAAVHRYSRADVVGVAYTDLITSEQNLVGVIGPYFVTLGAFWQAVADTASLLQTDDLFQLADESECPGVSDFGELLQLPCCHPCSPTQDPALRGASGDFPRAGFGPLPGAIKLMPEPASKTTLPAPAALSTLSAAPLGITSAPAVDHGVMERATFLLPSQDSSTRPEP
jgi:hypothetical protein